MTRLTVKTLTTILPAMLLVVSAAATAQTIYEWQDGKGERNYSDVPPESVNAKSTGIQITPTNEAQVKADIASKREATAKANEKNSQLAADKAKDDAAKEKQQATRDANCEQSKKALDTYNSMRRIYKTGPDGEIEWLDIDEERAKAQEQVNKWCK